MFSPNRVWFITGTSSGLGKSLTDILLANGERVVATCRDPSVHAKLSSHYKDQILTYKLDVTKEEQVKAALAAAVEKFGRIDVVVNNAGIGLFGEMESVPEEDARYIMELQFWGPVHVMKEAVRIFREINPSGAGGRIFNISTAGGYQANPTLSYYSASKFALEAATQSFLQEMNPSWNIKGCILEPGGFRSEWNSGHNSQVIPPHPAYTDPSCPTSMFRQFLGNIPFLGDPVKMGKAVLRLADLSMGVRSELAGVWAGEGVEKSVADHNVTGILGSTPVELPLRAQSTMEDAGQWAWISHSTNADDMDGENYVKQYLMGSGGFQDVDKMLSN
ncbi:NAD(P)-binding protein [Gymnopus androsaceus JB14]|uniref:NAD(P)-binding protein n=1 Tax=Gymnopus androsaceus JB14 TaxID=1447944 RepID=A0A6A4IC84_9AGAR|nr:NAD(P)-binding protein [Gymnopus androsaceus JB14]